MLAVKIETRSVRPMPYGGCVAAEVSPRTVAQRLLQLEELLRLQPDALLASTGEGADARDCRVLEFGPLYKNPRTGCVYPCWVELDRCLSLMKTAEALVRSRRRHMLSLFQAPTRVVMVEQRVQRTDRYRVPVFDERGQPVYARRRDGSFKTKPSPVAMPLVPTWVVAAEAHAGLRWLEHHYQGEPLLPPEAVRAA